MRASIILSLMAIIMLSASIAHALLLPSVTLPIALMQNLATGDSGKFEFYFFFFAGSGALGLGLKQIPSLLDKQKKVSDMKGGISLGGEDLPVNFIATLGYPEPLKIKDVENVIAKVNLKDVYDLGPKRSFMAKSMLERDGMMSAMSDCNPLAVYAVFEAFSGGGGDFASVRNSNEMLTKWRSEGGLDSFVSDLTIANTKRFSAYTFFAFLLFVIGDLIVESGMKGFF